MLQSPTVHTVTRPVVPIELALGSGITLRGVEHPEDGPPVVFVHDLGEDLDVWGPISREIASAGFRVISLEQRGHGLSDGEADPASSLDDLIAALALIEESFGPAGLVAHGGTAELGLALSVEHGVPVQILVSPIPLEEVPIDAGEVAPAMRAIFVGALDTRSDEHVRAIYPGLRGQNMWFSTGTDDRGPALLHNNPHMVEQIAMFLRRYLTGYHLAWVAEHHAEVVLPEAVESTREADT